MKVTLESTPTYTMLQGRRVRVWEGRTARGVPFIFFCSHVSVLQTSDSDEFTAELEERSLHHTHTEDVPVTPLEDVLRDFGRRHERPRSIDPRHVL